MSVIVIQVGQCGNQLGETLWTRLHQCAGDTQASPWFSPADGFARCILVDAEPKVVMPLIDKHPSLFRRENAVVGQSGRGNNWGAGYFGVCGSRSSPQRTGRCSTERPSTAGGRAFRFEKDQREDDLSLLPRVLCAVHNEALRIGDGHLEAIVVVHSLAGGTGSGFTSRLVEKLREHFTFAESESPNAEEDGLGGIYGERRKAQYVVSIAVAPSLKGETTVQGINTTLTLRSLFAATDGVILLRNDEAADVGCESLREFNDFFVNGLVLPVVGYGTKFGAIGDLVVRCAPDPRLKLLTLVPLPQRNYARLRECAFLSRAYFTVKSASDVGRPPIAVPFDAIHTRETQPLVAHLSSAQYFIAPKSFSKAGDGGEGTKDHRNGHVLVLNQIEEVNRTLLFPLLRDCKLKCDANAFLHRFNDAGVSREFIAESIRSVAATLCADFDLNS